LLYGKEPIFFIPFLFVVLVVVVFTQISKLKKFRSLNANRSRHNNNNLCVFLGRASEWDQTT
jgi:hypothetical protein